jgi:hypothetical protein
VADPAAVPMLRPWDKQSGLRHGSSSVRRTVKLIDDGETDGKILLSMLLSAAKQTGGGEAGLVRWALELQAVSDGSANYLSRFFFALFRYSQPITASFVKKLATGGVVVGPDSGYFDDLSQMDARLPVPDEFVDPRVSQNGYDRYLDAFADASYDLDYRPAAKGSLSRVIQLRYADGRRLDVDYLRVCDDFDPASMLSLMRSHVGPAGIAIPARISRGTAPRLFREKVKVVQRLKKDLDEFAGFLMVTIEALAQALPFGTVGQVVPLKQMFLTPARSALSARGAPATTPPAGGGRRRAVAAEPGAVVERERTELDQAATAGRATSPAARATEARLAGEAAGAALAQEQRLVARIVDDIEERSARRAVDDTVFMDLLDSGRAGVTRAGSRFHRIAELEALSYAEQGRLPAHYTLQAEHRLGQGAGSSRIDLLVTTPTRRPFEIDWKPSVLSGLSRPVRESEMPRHAAAILSRGAPLAGQESRSWGPAVVRMLRRAGRIESLTAGQRRALAPWL